MSKFRDIFVFAILIFLYTKTFTGMGSHVVYKPLSTGTIFDLEKNTSTPLIQTVQQPVFSLTSKDTILPTFSIFTELHTPEKFFCEIVDSKTKADYILVTEKLLERKLVFVPTLSEKTTVQVAVTPPSVKEKPTQKPTGKPEEKTIEKTKPAEFVFSFHTLRQYVQDNPKTYFYPQLREVGKEVTLKVISTTPYDSKNIVRFQILNNQKNYFFLGSISFLENNDPLPAEIFSEQFVSPEGSQEGYAVVKRTSKLTLRILESGGKQQCLEISFTLPHQA